MTQIEDDHLPFLAAGIPSVDIIDLEYPRLAHADGHASTASAPAACRSVGDVLLAALPQIEARLTRR